ncbi:MAG TPA: hypothetical protein VM074_06730 [Solimonas sp.]|nr:hypothetical protein [Solimonas sp.]
MNLRTSISAAFLLLAMGVAQAQAPGFDQLQDQGVVAYKAKDYKGLEQRMREALKLRPNHPRALYNLAASLALQGDAEGSLALLEKLAAMKLGYRPDKDPDFDSLKGSRWRKVQRQLDKNRQPRGRAQYAFTIGTREFLPEGIAYDPDSRRFFVSSVRQRRVLGISISAAEKNLVPPASNSLWSAMGMVRDPATQLLWIASSALPEMDGYAEADRGKAGLFVFSLPDGAPKARHLLPADGHEHVLGDVILGAPGTLYTSDSAGGAIYKVDAASGKFTRLTKPGALESPQGMALAKDGKRLYVADYNRGLFVLDLGTGALAPMQTPEDICLYGIDGLYRFEDRLVAVQNGTRPSRVMEFELDTGGGGVAKQRVLAANHPDFEEPTLGVIVDEDFYFVANSQWNRIGPDHQFDKVDDRLQPPVVLRIELD